jgi:P pilus assembly chaperone PapD
VSVTISKTVRRVALGLLGCIAAIGLPSAGQADVVLSQLIVELKPAEAAVGDVDVWNNSPDRAYVAAEPREIIGPGTAAQASRKEPNPEKLGLLVAPARMILEPGQHKLLRIASIGPAGAHERVYRITVKPEVGGLVSDKSGLKVLIGYDVLVLVRPAEPRPALVGRRSGNLLTFTNEGNVSIELAEGRQCDPAGRDCTTLPGKRLYAGAQWTEPLRSSAPVDYLVISPSGAGHRSF